MPFSELKCTQFSGPDSGIRRCHPSQTWRYQGSTVMQSSNLRCSPLRLGAIPQAEGQWSELRCIPPSRNAILWVEVQCSELRCISSCWSAILWVEVQTFELRCSLLSWGQEQPWELRCTHLSKESIHRAEIQSIVPRSELGRRVRLKRETYSCNFSLIFTIFLKKIFNQKGSDAWSQCCFA